MLCIPQTLKILHLAFQLLLLSCFSVLSGYRLNTLNTGRPSSSSSTVVQVQIGCEYVLVYQVQEYSVFEKLEKL